MKLLVTIAGLLSAVICVNAQITLTQSDMPKVGDVFIDGQDTTPSVAPGASGPGQTWDLSAIKNQLPETTSCVTPSSTPYFSDFPGSNLADSYRTNLTTAFGYSYVASSALQSLGNVVVEPTGPFVVINNPGMTTMPLPATYLTHWSDSPRQVSTSSTGADSIRQIFRLSITDTVDGWGTVKTPAGSFNSLRVKQVQTIVYDSLYFYSPLTQSWALLSASSGGTKGESFTWYAASKGAPVAMLTSDSTNGRTVNLAHYLTGPSAGVLQPPLASAFHPSPVIAGDHITMETAPGSDIFILNTQGRLVKRLVANGKQTTVNISSFPAGVYYFKAGMEAEMVVKK